MYEIGLYSVSSDSLQLLAVVEPRRRQQPVGEVEYWLCGTVILSQVAEFGVGHYLGEIVHRLEVGATEGVNALRVVAHTEQMAVLVEIGQQVVLERIGVLHLVHQYVVVFGGYEITRLVIGFQSFSNY